MDPTQQTEPQEQPQSAPDAIQAAIEAYRSQAATPLELPTEAPAEQPRDEQGRFTAQEADEPAEDAPEGENAPADDTEATPEGDEPAEGEDGEPFVLQIQPRREGEEPVELELGDVDPATREVIQAALNDGLRRDEFRRQMEAVERQRSELAEFEERLSVDPVGVLAEHVPEDVRAQTVLALLARDAALLERVQDELLEWEGDERARELARVRMDREIDERRDLVRDDLRARREAQAHATQLAEAIQSLVPQGADEQDVADFLTDARDYVRGVLQTREVAPDEIPQLLERRTRRYFGPSAAGAPRAPAVKPGPQAGVARPGSPEAQALADRVQQAKQTGRRFVQASVRRAAAATSPAGAGSAPATSPKPPKGAGIKGAVEFYRQQGHL